MLHYATIMERKGPLWNMNCMRPESKNRDSKITSRITLNRTNISKTLAIKSQLILNHRLRNRLVSNKLYESNKSTLKSVPELQEYCSYAKLLSFSLSDKVTEFDFITFRGKDIQKNVILMMLTESDRCFFNVHAIFEDNANTLFIVPKDITEFIYYDEHFQSYRLHGSSINVKNWKILNIQDLKYCNVSRICFSGNGFQYIPKRWI
ncbi:Protein of unknown function [Cotesia congregata]|uniref:Uncharacterized protein n=1 Tax=Cotesia congregata TaxID=51543 RepID=A0A8J2MSV7_COTCN|nr:Protein of unknown function [Cotesia congregata]